MQFKHVKSLCRNIYRSFRARKNNDRNKKQDHDASPPIRASNDDNGHSARLVVPASNVDNGHSTAPPATASEGGAEDDDPFATLRKSLVSAANSQENNIQPTNRLKSSQTHGRASEVKSVQAITPLKVPEAPRVQPPTRQPTVELDIYKTNQDNPSWRLLQPQTDHLSPVWGSTPQGSRSMHKSPEGIGKRKLRNPPPVVDEDPLTGDIFPHAITVSLTLTFNGGSEAVHEWELHEFNWTTPDSFQKLSPQGILHKLQDRHEELKTQDMYCRYGSCKVEGSTGRDYDMPVSMVEDYEQLSQQAIKNICAFIAKHLFKEFRLNVRWDYGCAQIQKPNKEQLRNIEYSGNYTTMIRKELQKKMRRNFMGQEYIPRRDLDVFLQLNVIHEILIGDRSLTLDPTGQETFAMEIQRSCPKLFTICVFREIELRVLLHLIRKHECGDNPGQRPQMRMICHENGCNSDNFQWIIREEPKFFGEKMIFDYQHRNLSDEKILPLQNTGDDDLRGTAKREELGEGISGKVFAVKLDLAHNLSEDSKNRLAIKDADYRLALKQFHDQSYFDKEIEILKRFADTPHPHIVQHLTSWNQSNVYYILYHKARCNLRIYIKEWTNPDLTGLHVLWFIGQLKGLASAIDHVHHFKRPSPSNPNPKEDNYWGRHNDLKPENILVFEKTENENPIFKVTDFGLGVFNEPTKDTSRQDPIGNGTEGYFPPEKVVSRPFDMWALGCVFLELVLWLFGFYQDPNAKGFTTKRISFPGQDPSIRIDNFWIEEPSRPGEYRRKPAVEDALQDLKTTHCFGMRAFQDILSAINKLLDVDPVSRYDSVQLLDKLKSILTQAQADILGQGGEPDYYYNQLKQNLGETEFSGQLPSARIDPDISPLRTRAPSFSSHRSRSEIGDPAILAHMTPTAHASKQSEPLDEAEGLEKELETFE